MSTKNSGRKRFSDDQMKSLETTFESESRPELHLKQHLASRLGLQPRQIAIWFQNKRARSKSKQVEREFSILKSKYLNLASQMEALRKENESLVIQVQRLRKMSEENEDEKKNEMRLASSENRGVVINTKSDDECRAGFNDQNKDVDVPKIVEDGCNFECCTFFDNNDNDSLWWEF